MSGRLMVFKSGDEKWRLIDGLPSPYDDVIVRGERFYAVDNSGRLVIIDAADLNVSDVASSVFGGDKKFLVDSNGEVLLVDMYLSVGPVNDLGFKDVRDCYTREKTVKLKVFRLDENMGEWIEVNHLRDKMLFLGDNCSYSVSSSEISRDDGFKGDCVFFTEQCCAGESNGVWKGIMVFDLESGCIESVSSYVGYSRMFWPPPDWVYPTTSIEVENI